MFICYPRHTGWQLFIATKHFLIWFNFDPCGMKLKSIIIIFIIIKFWLLLTEQSKSSLYVYNPINNQKNNVEKNSMLQKICIVIIECQLKINSWNKGKSHYKSQHIHTVT